MGFEIERKFLVTGMSWRDAAQPLHCVQGYLSVGPPASVRARIMDGTATLNIKKSVLDIGRTEFEYEIPLEDAQEMLDHLCMGEPVEKTRHKVEYGGMVWEVDVFHGANEGLIVAEIELEDAGQAFEPPPWLGEEVSHDARYFNSHLSKHPYSTW